VREHRNRDLAELGPQATAILVTALRRAGLTVDRAPHHELLRYDADFQPERVEVEVRERPPIITIPAYRRHHGRELSA
jgi:glucosyl-3-phosphoglycerate synthase